MKRKILALCLVVVLGVTLLSGCTDGKKPPASSILPPSGEVRPSTNMPATSSVPAETSSQPATSSAPASSTPAAADSSRATLSTDFGEIGALSRTPITWGPGVRKNAAGRSEACDLLQLAYGDRDALFIGPDNKTIYLTFDQGYENGYTEAILDVLKEKGVKGVFFLTGHYINTAPELVQRMIDEGHVLGNHSYGHPNYATATAEDAFADMKKLHEAVYEKWGIAMDLFRFPEGAFSEQSLGLVQSTGYTSVFWSFAYNDWDPANQMEPAAALKRALEGAHNGAIFLFHTVGKTNSLILGDVIDNLRAQGYNFGLVEPMQAPAQPEPPPESSSASSSSSEGNIFLRPRG